MVFVLLGVLANAQTLLKVSTIIAGSENVQLVYNGDFQLQGPTLNMEHPFPTGWSRSGDMFAGPGVNMSAIDSGVVARRSEEQ